MELELDFPNLIESVLRWLHVLAGVAWIGHLYFFNWVNAYFAPTLDAESKKKVVPELMPRALYVFRWGAAYTWLTGVLLLVLIYYHNRPMMLGEREWGPIPIAFMVLVLVAPFIYDPIMKAIKNTKAQAAVGFVLAAAYLLGARFAAGYEYRAYSIHLGAVFGTIMAYNVWFRIWPAQKQIITAVKNGTAPDAALVALAGGRSKHNTYMSVPLLFTMISQHGTWAASYDGALLLVVVALGWALTLFIYNKTKTVKGF